MCTIDELAKGCVNMSTTKYVMEKLRVKYYPYVLPLPITIIIILAMTIKYMPRKCMGPKRWWHQYMQNLNNVDVNMCYDVIFHVHSGILITQILTDAFSFIYYHSQWKLLVIKISAQIGWLIGIIIVRHFLRIRNNVQNCRKSAVQMYFNLFCETILSFANANFSFYIINQYTNFSFHSYYCLVHCECLVCVILSSYFFRMLLIVPNEIQGDTDAVKMDEELSSLKAKLFVSKQEQIIKTVVVGDDYL
ncbi:Hypothetical_protein [Hexamita inflata]|uniref:Hypothetical_protein n=1 Tax=Hexamita inflata TaxID=28002 RepID=A0AA86U754_9EUKA|nr:Hypothetical protein HINF_LOCUS33075 [Hexamita inflata]